MKLENIKIIEFETLNSTNLYAVKNIKILNHFDIIIAKTQTQGKGRNNNTWISELGNLYASIIFKKDINPLHIPFLISLAIKDILKSEICLKWPNDIYYHDKSNVVYKKLGGILSEKILDNIVIGIGLNIKNAPKIQKYPSISLNDLGLDFEPNELAKLILKEFAILIEKYKAKGFEYIKTEWLKACCHYNKKVKIDNDSGIFIGLDENGFALVKQGNLIKTAMAGSLDM